MLLLLMLMLMFFCIKGYGRNPQVLMTRVWALFLLGGKGSAKMEQNSVQHNATGALMRGQTTFRFVKQNLKFSYYHILTLLGHGQ
jgi:hypothetical protein